MTYRTRFRRVSLRVCSQLLSGTVLLTFACKDGTGPDDRRAAARLAIVSGDAQAAEVGAELAQPLVVRVEDAGGHPVRQQLVNFRVVRGGGSVFAGSAITGDDGIARERWTLGTTAADSQQVEARAVDQATGNAIVFATFTARATAGAPAAISVTAGDGQSAEAGTLLPTPLAIRVVDRFANPVRGATVTWAPAPQQGTVDAATSTTDSTGIATARWTLGTTAGPLRLEARSGTLAPVSFAATARAAAPARLESVRGDAQRAEVGTAVAVAPAVRVLDAHGNQVAGASVAFSVVQGGGTIASSSVVTGTDGVASVGAWTLGSVAGAQRLRASIGALAVEWTSTADPGAPSALVIEAGDGATATVGTTLASPPTLRVVDRFGNGVAGVTVTFTVESGGGTLAGAAARATDEEGRVTSGPWTLGTTSGANTVRVTTGTLVATFGATATPGPASTLARLAGDSQVGVAGEATTLPPSVRVSDAFGNAIAGVDVTFAVTGGGGQLVGVSTVATGADGIARVTGWTFGTVVGTNTMTASARGLEPVTFTATTRAGAAASLAIHDGDAQSVAAGKPVPVSPAVLVTDRHGNAVAGVTVAFEVLSGGGAVEGSPVITGTDGVAAVQGWTLGATAGPNMLRATVGSLPPVTFVATARAGDAAKVSILGGNAQVGDLGRPLPAPLVVRVTDASGNVVPGAQVSWRVVDGGGSITADSPTDGAGLASATWTLAARLDTTYAAEATVVGQGVVRFTATPRLPNDIQVAVAGGDGQSDTLQATLATSLSARVSLADGRFVQGAPARWATGSGQLLFATTTSDTTGLVRATWKLGTAAGTRSTVVMVGPAQATFTATVRAGSPTSSVIVSGDFGVAPSNTVLGDTLVVRFLDRANNAVAGVAATWALAVVDRGTLTPLSSSTDARGEARALWTLGAPGLQRASVTVGGATAQLHASASMRFASLSVGSRMACGIEATTRGLWCWGTFPPENAGGTGMPWRTPRLVDASRAYASVTIGADHACALDTGGRAYCWGDGTYGQLGVGGGTPASAPQQVGRIFRVGPTLVLTSATFREIRARGRGTCALQDGGALWCWGQGFLDDMLCSPSSMASISSYSPCTPAPKRVHEDLTVRAFDVGCATDADGTLHCGFGSARVRMAPGVPVSIVRTKGNYVSSSENNASCILGTGSEVACYKASYLDGGGWAPVAATASTLETGVNFACGTSGPSTICWGQNDHLQLGVASTSTCRLSTGVVVACSTTPLGVGAYHGVSTGLETACALDADGSAWCWGADPILRGGYSDQPYMLPRRVRGPDGP